MIEKRKLFGGEDHPQTTLHSLRGVLLFTVCDWFSAQGIFQHLPALGASIFHIRDLKRTPQPPPWLQGAGQLLSTVLDKPLWERRPKSLALLPREGGSPWQAQQGQDGGAAHSLPGFLSNSSLLWSKSPRKDQSGPGGIRRPVLVQPGPSGEESTFSAGAQEAQVCSLVGKIPWRRKWHPTPALLPGESRGQRSLAGYSPWGHRVGHN